MKLTMLEIKEQLTQFDLHSRSNLVREKCRKARANVRRAEALIDKATATLLWAQNYKPEDHETYV